MWNKQYSSALNLILSLALSILIKQILSTTCEGTNSRGTTFPSGDIKLTENSDLEINCTLKSAKTHNSSSIYWVINTTTIVSKEYINIVSQTTATLKIPAVKREQSGLYTCSIRDENFTICNNQVIIGTVPPRNVPIQCISKNLESMNCSWLVPYNPMETNWTLSYSMNRNWYPCIQQDKSNWCEIKDEANRRYPYSVTKMSVILKGVNYFNVKNASYTPKKFLHYQYVILNPPKDLIVTDITSQSAKIRWNNPLVANLTQDVLVMYKIECGYGFPFTNREIDCQENGNETYSTDMKLEHLKPNMNYTIRVYARLNTTILEKPWSEPSIFNFTTLSKIPDQQVNITSGSYLQHAIDNNTRSITIYWKEISPYHYNGFDFAYLISSEVFHNRSLKNATNSVTFQELSTRQSYNFVFQTKNNVGLSDKSSQLFVPKFKDVLQPPKVNDVIKYDNNTYEISWISTYSLLTKDLEYTVYWCAVKYEDGIPMRCEEPGIDWTFVKDRTTCTIYLPDDEKIYKFAVSLSNGVSSSGLEWSGCTVKETKDRHKIQSLKYERVGTNWAIVSWVVPCAQRSKAIKGYLISYKGSETEAHNVTIRDLKVNSYNLTGLKPNTDYSVKIAVISNRVESFSAEENFLTTESPVTKDETVTIIIAAVGSLGVVFFSILTYYIYKRYTEKIAELRNIPLPKGLTSYESYKPSTPSPSPTNPSDKLDVFFHWPSFVPESPTFPDMTKQTFFLPASLSKGRQGSIFSTTSSGIPSSPKTENGRPSTDSGVGSELQDDDVFEPNETLHVGYSRIGPYRPVILDANELRAEIPLTHSYAKLALTNFSPNVENGKVKNHYVTLPGLNNANANAIWRKDSEKSMNELNTVVDVQSTNPVPESSPEERVTNVNTGYIRYPFT